jgi:hypothetical protein
MTPAAQRILFVVVIETPHTEEPLSECERETNCRDAKLAIQSACDPEGAGHVEQSGVVTVLAGTTLREPLAYPVPDTLREFVAVCEGIQLPRLEFLV